MPRIRTIKPDFFTSETVTLLSYRARLTWVGLWTHCDDEGRCRDNAKLIRAAIWPLDDVSVKQVEQDLEELGAAGRIIRYEVAGKRYIEVTNWAEHQKINRPVASKFPPPSGARLILHGGLSEDSVSDPGGLTTGKERKGKEQGSVTRAERVSEFFADFWASYPRKADKARAQKAYLKAADKADPTELNAAAARFAARCAGKDLQYVPHPTTWLNGERWNDEDTSTPQDAPGNPWDRFVPPAPPPEVADDPAAYQQWMLDKRAEWEARRAAGGER